MKEITTTWADSKVLPLLKKDEDGFFVSGKLLFIDNAGCMHNGWVERVGEYTNFVDEGSGCIVHNVVYWTYLSDMVAELKV